MSRQKTPWWVRLNRTFFYVMGPAQLGRRDEPPAAVVEARCPLCSQPMVEHHVARSNDPAVPTRLRCPLIEPA